MNFTSLQQINLFSQSILGQGLIKLSKKDFKAPRRHIFIFISQGLELPPKPSFTTKNQKTQFNTLFQYDCKPVDLAQQVAEFSHSFCDLSPIDIEFPAPQIMIQKLALATQSALCTLQIKFKGTMDRFTGTFSLPSQPTQISSKIRPSFQNYQSSSLSFKSEFFLGLSNSYQEKKYDSRFLDKLNQGSTLFPKDHLKGALLKQVISDLHKPSKQPPKGLSKYFFDINCAEED